MYRFCSPPVNDRKKLTHDNHELKNQLLAIDTENVSPNRNHRDEQVSVIFSHFNKL